MAAFDLGDIGVIDAYQFGERLLADTALRSMLLDDPARAVNQPGLRLLVGIVQIDVLLQAGNCSGQSNQSPLRPP